MPDVRIEKLIKRFGNVTAIDGVDIHIPDGKIVTLLGPSGCGKTTTLRCLAGFENADEGQIWIGDRLVFDSGQKINISPQKRGMGMVFQSYAVWPHMSVFENIAFPLRIRKASGSEVNERVLRAMQMVGIEELKDRLPSEISGGQQQRVAFARAIVYEPAVLLLDEPLSNLDAKLREQMRFEILELQRKIGVTTVYVTHDQEEAMVLSDEVLVMEFGKVIQRGDPEEIYFDPVNEFVADFIGKINFLRASVLSRRDDGSVVSIEEESFRTKVQTTRTNYAEGQKVLASVRPENIIIYPDKPQNEVNTWPARLVRKNFLGGLFDMVVEVKGKELRCRTPFRVKAKSGSDIYIQIDPKDVLLIGVKNGAKIRQT
ncbi:MAG: ABC transporter ATP-binding protein [Desulfobacterales bacterium]|nr:ABC transporter ATP-binding protein [Desulfobacterales bacterium]